MPPLTPEQRMAQSWMSRAQATPTLEPQQLCNVQLSEDLARPWMLTVYAQTVGGGLTAPRNPMGPSSPVAPVLALPSFPSALRVQIGAETVVMDYPGRGGVYAVSPCAQLNVSLVASWAGLVPPAADQVPVYSVRVTEAEGAALSQPTLAVPRYTYQVGQLEVGATFFGLVPVRAHAVTIYTGDNTSGTEQLTLTWMDDAGQAIAAISVKAGPGPAAGDASGHELTTWAIPPRATQWSLGLPVGVNDVPNIAALFHLSL